MQKNTYEKKEFLNRLREIEVTNSYSNEELNDIVQQLEASRGYTEKDIKHLINFIRKHHSYSREKMKRMLETLNVPDQYSILHYGVRFNNVSFCRCLINDFGCGKIVLRCLLKTSGK